jgi:hypothetical protein
VYTDRFAAKGDYKKEKVWHPKYRMINVIIFSKHPIKVYYVLRQNKRELVIVKNVLLVPYITTK